MTKEEIDRIAARLRAIKAAIVSGTTVYYHGSPYKPTACILRYIQGQWLYSVELKDTVTNNCLVYVEMEKIEFEVK